MVVTETSEVVLLAVDCGGVALPAEPGRCAWV